MQSLLFLKRSEDAEIDRVINIDLMSTACIDPENPTGTVVYCGNSIIKMSMSFKKFVEQVEYLISENYRVSLKSSAEWHEKRVKDAEESMRVVMKEVMGKL